MEKDNGIMPADLAFRLRYGEDVSAIKYAQAMVNSAIKNACEAKKTSCLIEDGDIPCITREAIMEELIDKGYTVDLTQSGEFSPTTCNAILFEIRWE